MLPYELIAILNLMMLVLVWICTALSEGNGTSAVVGLNGTGVLLPTLVVTVRAEQDLVVGALVGCGSVELVAGFVTVFVEDIGHVGGAGVGDAFVGVCLDLVVGFQVCVLQLAVSVWCATDGRCWWFLVGEILFYF